MNVEKSQTIPAPPSLLKSYKAGFDVITNHLGLIFLPLILDLTLWLGPHIRLRQIIQAYLVAMRTLPGIDSTDTAEFLKMNQEIWEGLAERFNVFTFIRTYPVGVPSMMVSVQPISTPVGNPYYWDIPSFASLLGLWVLVSLVGLIVGALYFWLVGQAAIGGKIDWHEALTQWPWVTLQVFMLSLIWIIIFIMISLPVSCLLSLLFVNGMMIGNLGVLVLGGLLLWILFPLLFSPHGIFINHRLVWASIFDSIRLTRYTLPTTSLLFLSMLVVSEGLDILWRTPGETSWFTLVGIAGHSFITTGLLAVTFIYYRDTTDWVAKVLQQVKVVSVT